ncbi:hypothetical protein BHU72_07610 [Desulfuribacillus stibiiarsenatis]|uniref:Molybdopterin molybdenumtransferase n=1 Tax=Desulfuribacillus stibiiarsenatis TaxID=1390249 RepID=A0A1E5L3N9_9FIRM|nr:gephyrin-like molybdotransferase Glp [Desulfuribacillus stibiiarsenatis]OEH84696.1 hypothetical protein BHU72_07610 [Desulfuribacillus stibiiarsenatis]
MFYVKTVSVVMEECFAKFTRKQENVTVALEDSLGFILGEDIIVSENIPGFDRSTVDGFAVYAEDTFGSSESMPSFLKVTGEILMGREADNPLHMGQTQKIPTGGMLPAGSNAVVMQEYTELLDDMVSIYKSVSPGENVIKVGEDLKDGQTIFKKGIRIRPQDIGLLAAMGIVSVNIIKPLKIAVISTGDEIVGPEVQHLAFGQVRDTNGYAVTALLKQYNFQGYYAGIIKDDYDTLYTTVHKLYEQYDVVILSGGSSVGTKDVTSKIIETLPNAEILVHGIAIKPGKPTIIAKSNGKLIIGLPGHPVSALVIMQHIILPILHHMQGTESKTFLPAVQAIINQNIDSQTGRTDIIRVRLTMGEDQHLIAEPERGKAGVFSSLVKADGYFIIPESVEGIEKGSMIDVLLYD